MEVEVKRRRVALSLALLKAISVCVKNGTSPFQLKDLWYCVLGDSILATAPKLTGRKC